MRPPVAILLALALLAAGCIGKPGEDEVVPAAETEPAIFEPEPAPSPAPTAASPAPSSSTAPAPSASNAAAAPPPEQAAPATRVEVTMWNGTITGFGVSPPQGPICCWWFAAAGQMSGEFDVPEAPTAILLELVWTHAQFDLELELYGPDWEIVMVPDPAAPATSRGHSWSATGGLPGQPDGRAAILVTDPDALALTGTYAWRVGTEGAAHEAPFTVAVSLFYGETPPDGHSAFATPSGNP